MESVKFFLFAFSHLSLFKRDFFLDFSDQKFIKLIFFFLLNFLSFIFVFDLSVSHLLFEINLSLVFFFFFSFSLIIEFSLLLLEFEVLLTLFFLAFFLSAFFFHLLIELFFYFFLKLFFSHFLEFFFFFEKFSIKLHQSGPFVFVVTLDLVNWFWINRTCLRTSFWTGNLAFGILFLLLSLWWYLASFLNAVSLIDLLFGDLRFGFFWGRLFWIKNKCYSSDFAFCTHQQLWRHLAWGL